MNHTFVETNGIRLHVVQAGPVDGPLLILLHGFPEFWYGWKRQIEPLAAAGYQVWVPDQRGYNLSDKPAGIEAYTIDTLAADVVGLIERAGQQKAVLVGHDWGAAVAWWTAATYPDRVERLVVMNVPHPAVMKRFVSRDLGQMRRSWYIGFFQLPKLPEWLSSLGDWSMLARTLRKSSRRGTFSEADLQQYKTAWGQPGALRAMINWYRATLQKPPKRSPRIRIIVPTLLIWGAQDQFLKRDMAQPSIDLCDNGRLVFLEQATHWVQHEEADRVNTLLLEFLQ
ncbi:alpha/beta hydrolase [Spirosoma taeanense]|uniref:Alpha/beta hydrolase n=1 Tax=Spirosoma taeanense TaxID=2735870 RepID=A0A6M5Y5N9_9BACT|nr:alpha/beta hydrolase [Spirosoma taeanense]QJW88774.1 alpha/beta hydrolase [Spirosoma taeanense]